MEKYIKDGQVGVLVSHGFGAGWSTWNGEYGMNLALDKRIIEKLLELSDEDNDIKYDVYEKQMEEYLETIGYKNVYCGGLDGLELHMVDVGTAIKINEYDGNESLEYGYSDFTSL